MHYPKVSIIMAAYNSERYIVEAVDSILNQTFNDFELIITNDCSTDNTAKIISSYKDQRVKVLTNEKNQGAPYSRNRAIREAKGKYIAILDADDVSLPNRLQVQVDFLEQNTNIDGVGSYVYEINSSGQKIRTVKPPVSCESVKCSTFFRCSVVHSSAMIRLSFFIENNLFYNETYPSSQDYEMWSRAVFIGKIGNIPKYLTLYRCSDTQMSVQNKDIQKFHAIRVYENLLHRLGLMANEEEIRMHALLINHIRLSSFHYAHNVIGYAKELYRKNNEIKIFDNTIFAHEILLRFLKFCVVNKIGIFRILYLQFKLHRALGKLYLPYPKMVKRLSGKLHNINSV